MIVFTATDKVSGKVFAGSTRLSLEDHWDNLLTQEAEGAMGEFFETLRKSGVAAFKIEEYGYSDNPRELREILAEAMDDLGALPIKPVLGSVRKAEAKATNDIMKELEALKQEMADGSDDDFEPVSKLAKKEADSQPMALEVNQTKAVAKAPEPKPLRHTKSTEEAAEMRALIAGIEARRRANLKSNQRSANKKTAAKKSPERVVQAKASALQDSADSKLAVGRSGSSAKEKRIREAIAAQKAEMEAQKRSKVADEAAEMREIMARLDERAKTAARIHRRM